YYPGTGSTVYFQQGATGGFTVGASSPADGESGVSGYSFPDLGTDWTHTAGAYSFGTNAGTDSGDVTALNNAGLESSGTTFHAQADASAPTSSIDCNTTTCATGWYTASPVSIAIHAADTGAGVKRIKYTTDGSDPVANGTAVDAADASFDLS